jgi:hypothetical protein
MKWIEEKLLGGPRAARSIVVERNIHRVKLEAAGIQKNLGKFGYEIARARKRAHWQEKILTASTYCPMLISL